MIVQARLYRLGLREIADDDRSLAFSSTDGERVKLEMIGAWSTALVVSANPSHMLARTAQSVDLTLDEDGAEVFEQALDERDCIRLEAALADLPTNTPGVRIRDGSQQVFSCRSDLEVASAGTNRDAENPLTTELVAWADMMFVMEKAHRSKLQRRFRAALSGKRVICLDIPDEYAFMQPELVRLLEARVSRHLPAIPGAVPAKSA